MNVLCSKCGSLNFEGEKKQLGHFSICCHNGKINLPAISWPEELNKLYMNGDGDIEIENLSKDFFPYIRNYNSSFAFASVSAKLAPAYRNMKPNAATTFVKIHGQIYHRSSDLYPMNESDSEAFAQLYILDDELALKQRLKVLTHFTPNIQVKYFFTIIFNFNINYKKE